MNTVHSISCQNTLTPTISLTLNKDIKTSSFVGLLTRFSLWVTRGCSQLVDPIDTIDINKGHNGQSNRKADVNKTIAVLQICKFAIHKVVGNENPILNMRRYSQSKPKVFLNNLNMRRYSL